MGILTLTKNKANLIFAFLVLAASIVVLWDANWTLGDDNQFITTTAIGLPVYGWCGSGRFFPLGLFDCSVLLFVPFGNTAVAHLLYSCVMMISSSVIFFNLLKKITNHDYLSSLLSIILLFFSAPFLQVHMACFFCERIIFFLSSIIMFCLWMAEYRHKTKYYIFAFISSVYMTYTKEPIFGSLGIIALMELIFCIKLRGGVFSDRKKIFYISILINCFIFIVIYAYFWFKNPPTEIYGSDRMHNIFYTIFTCWRREPYLIIATILSVIRAFSILFKKDKEQLLIDSFLFAGIGYMLAIFILGFIQAYYYFPAVCFSLPAFAYYLCKLKDSNKISQRNLLIASLIIVIAISTVRSVREVKKNLRLRAGDMPAIEYLVNQCRNGLKITFFTTEPYDWCIAFTLNAMKYIFNMENIPYSIINRKDCISDKPIVIIPAGQKDKNLLDQKLADFYLYYRSLYIDIYIRKNYK